MHKWLFFTSTICCGIFFSVLFAEDTAMVIDSGVANYDGKLITLTGDVVVEHELGTISAGCVELTTDSSDKNIHTSCLSMKEGVNIKLKDGGNLSCALADVDYRSFEGKFHGNELQEYVTYTENDRNKGNELSLTVKSRHMHVQLGKSETAPQSRRCISTIAANDNVIIGYQNDFTASGDYATYQRLPSEESTGSARTLTGLIALHSADKDGICQVVNNRGDTIKANHICIDTLKRQLLFAYPQGKLSVARNQGAEFTQIDFSSDTMIWDEKQNALTLRDHVVINQQGIGTLTNDKEIQLFQQETNGSKQLSTIESLGTTILTYTDDDNSQTHTLTCYGKACVNHQSCQTVMESPRDSQGKVIEGKQVYFKDNLGEIYSDKLTVQYTMLDGVPLPTKLILEGHVRLFGRSSALTEDTSTFLQYALADVVEYNPQAKELVLVSKGKNRVLFYDRTNNLQVSAPKIKVRRDQTTNKESIQGMGDVRFSFIEKELEAMKKAFSDGIK